jgi:hypothetical protein
MGKRTERLHAAVKEFAAVHDKWSDAQTRPNPDESYADAIEGMFQVFDQGEIPADCRQLAAKVATLQMRWEEYVDQREAGERVYPANEFWEAREKLIQAFSNPVQRPVFKPLESIALLRHQQVPDRLIAKIYGLIGENGEPQSHLVQQEIDQPGSVIGPDTGWVDSRVREWEAQQRESDKYADGLVEKHQAAKAAAEPVKCPESITDLFEQKVGVKQAAKMLKMFEADVEKEFARLKAEREAGNSGGDADTAAMVYLLHDEKKTVEQIAKEVKLSPKKVADLIKNRPPASVVA